MKGRGKDSKGTTYLDVSFNIEEEEEEKETYLCCVLNVFNFFSNFSDLRRFYFQHH